MTTAQNILESPGAAFRALLRDDRLRAQYLPPLSTEQVQAIEEYLPSVLDAAGQWVSRFPELNPATLVPATLLKIGQLYPLAVRDITTAVEWEIWVFAFDDLFDQEHRAFSETSKIIDECYAIAIARPGTEQARSGFGVSFLEIKDALAAHRTFRDLQAAFVGTLAWMIDGVTWVEQNARGPRPSFDEYLYHAGHAFWHPFVWSLPLFDDEAISTELSRFLQLADQCARACRLSNDLRTLGRELREGVLNGLTIRLAELAASSDAGATRQLRKNAEHYVRAAMLKERENAHATARTITTPSAAEAAFIRLMELSIETYERKDVREWTASLARSQRSGGERGAPTSTRRRKRG